MKLKINEVIEDVRAELLCYEEGEPEQVINHPQQERTKAFLSRFQQ